MSMIRALEQFKRLSEEDGFQRVVIVFLMRIEFSDYPLVEYHEQVLQMLEGMEVMHIDLLPEYKKHAVSDLRVLRPDVTRPNDLGRRLAAQKISTALLDLR